VTDHTPMPAGVAPPAAVPTSRRTTVRIGPSSAWVLVPFAELVEYRELLYFLAWRDIKVRYKQTVLGVGGAVLQPLLSMVLFSVFFGRLVGVPSDNIPYPVFSYCALLPWQLFSSALTSASNSVVMNHRLVTKVYVPRIIIPVSATVSALVDFAVSFAILVPLMAIYGIAPGPAVLALPLLVALGMLAALGAGLWLSALHVRYRDVRHTLAFLMQLWLFATPVAYPSSLVPEAWRTLYGLNPMVSVVEGFRWALLGASLPPVGMLAASFVSLVVVLVSGLYYFARTESSFADLI